MTAPDTHHAAGTLPAYVHIANELRQRIHGEEWVEGDRLPDVRSLAGQYGVALGTIQRALALLCAEQYLRTEEKRGVFLARRRPHPAALTPPASPVGALTIGIVAPIHLAQQQMEQTETAVAVTIFQAAEQALTLAGWRVQLFACRYGDSATLSPAAATRTALASGIDALITINAYNDPDWLAQIVAETALTALPVVYISVDEERAPFPHVYFDQKTLGYDAARHLLHAGYTRLLFCSPFSPASADDDWIAERLTGCRIAIAQMGLPETVLTVAPRTARFSANHYYWHITAEQREAHLQHVFDAVFARWDFRGDDAGAWGVILPNDDIALQFQRAMTARGLRPGQDAGLIGFDNLSSASLHGITSIRQPYEALGVSAAQMLMRMLQDAAPAEQLRLSSAVIPRASTRRATLPEYAGMQQACQPGTHPIAVLLQAISSSDTKGPMLNE